MNFIETFFTRRNRQCESTMFPNAALGYMPFITGNKLSTSKNKGAKLAVNSGKLCTREVENRKRLGMATQKMYQITLRDKKGNTYKCVVNADGTQSLPSLCERSVPELISTHTHRSMPDITLNGSSASKQRIALTEKLQAMSTISDSGENFSMSLDLRDCGKKPGFIRAIINFFRPKTCKRETKTDTREAKASKHKSNRKSKRKPNDASQRKRRRTISAMSNLDPIEESPNEHEFEKDDEDTDSYGHYSSSCSSDCDSFSSRITCNSELVTSSSKTS